MTSLDGGPVSDFVKTSILDAEPIDIAKMRDSLESYKRKKEAVVRTKKQIEQLTQIFNIFKNAKSKATFAAAYEWCAAVLKSRCRAWKDRSTQGRNVGVICDLP